MSVKKIGVIGCGVMGSGIILSLQKKGYLLNLYDRTHQKALQISRGTDMVCRTPEELAKNSEIIFAITSDDISSGQVWFGKNGAALGMNAKSICIEMSTLSLDYIEEWTERIRKNGSIPVACPMTGSREGANTSSLTVFFGGEKNAFEVINPILKELATTIFYFPSQINAMKFKLIYNYFGASILLIFAEILSIILDNEYSTDYLFEILSSTGWGQFVVKNEYKKMLNREYDDVECCLYNICKDIKYAYKTFLSGRKNNLEILSKVAQKYDSLEKSELNQKDMSIVFETFFLD